MGAEQSTSPQDIARNVAEYAFLDANLPEFVNNTVYCSRTPGHWIDGTHFCFAFMEYLQKSGKGLPSLRSPYIFRTVLFHYIMDRHNDPNDIYVSGTTSEFVFVNVNVIRWP